ncbi:DUF3696 domain-containing protein [Herpetosiphon sp. NSE202]|uniref:AAA family ATPase n=1 Tax=Herpetosiphon sp. NSE202 TaxID=3351349 RepID=UPI00363CA029
MIEQLRIQNFKSWRDTGTIRFAPITGFFGANSSGKTSLLHFLLMLKQTVESQDRQLILNLEGPYTDLGLLADVMYQHIQPQVLDFNLTWHNSHISTPVPGSRGRSDVESFKLHSQIQLAENTIEIQTVEYLFAQRNKEYRFAMLRDADRGYRFESDGYRSKDPELYHKHFASPRRFHEFPMELYQSGAYQKLRYLHELGASFTQLMFHVNYLGPLREFPARIYRWGGERHSLGNRGENAIQVLLADYHRHHQFQRTTKKVALWLQQLGLIQSFELHRIAPERREFEVRVRLHAESTEVLLTEVGFGVSQVLPVLVLCASAAKNAILILEQPEIHLHPAVQAGLADILIETSQRGVQVILESHSEHLLRRLQRRIAEAKLTPQETALYFCESDKTGTSQLKPLEVDTYGNINNWPEHFFGDEMGDLAAMTIAAMERQIAEGNQ